MFNWLEAKTRQRLEDLLFCFLIFIKFFVYDVSMIPSASMTPTFHTGDLVFVNKHAVRWSFISVLPWGGMISTHKGYEFCIPKKGTPCAFTMPKDATTYYLKRIVGYAGDTVQMKEGIVYIKGNPVQVSGGVLHVNDKPVKMEWIKEITLLNDENEQEKGTIYRITLSDGTIYHVYRNAPFGEGGIDNTDRYEVPKGHVWMQGDNHTGSSDSFSVDFMGPIPTNHLISVPQFILINSNARGESKSWSEWLVKMPYNILRFIYHLNFSRFFLSVNSV